MAVQNWSDILKSSKKTALLNDGEFFTSLIKFDIFSRNLQDLLLVNNYFCYLRLLAY